MSGHINIHWHACPTLLSKITQVDIKESASGLRKPKNCKSIDGAGETEFNSKGAQKNR